MKETQNIPVIPGKHAERFPSEARDVNIFLYIWWKISKFAEAIGIINLLSISISKASKSWLFFNLIWFASHVLTRGNSEMTCRTLRAFLNLDAGKVAYISWLYYRPACNLRFTWVCLNTTYIILLVMFILFQMRSSTWNAKHLSQYVLP